MTVVQLPTRFTIGGSDAAAAAGVDPHRSRMMLWHEKKGLIEREPTEAMMWGRLLEPVIYGVLAEQYDLMPAPADGFTDPEHSWRICHPDAFAEIDGLRATVDIKTANQWTYKWNGAAPIPYQAQLQHNMSLTGDSLGLLATLVNGQKLETRVIERSDSDIATLIELEEEFYDLLVRDEMPGADGSDSTREALHFAEATPGRVMRLDRDSMAFYRQLKLRKAQRDAVDEQMQTLENLLKAVMRDAEVAIGPHDDELIRWRNVTSTRTDVKGLREAHPEIASAFVTTTQTRRFQAL